MKSPTITTCPNFAASVISVNTVWSPSLVWSGGQDYCSCTTFLLLDSEFFTYRSFPQYFHAVAHPTILHKQCNSPGQTVLIFLWIWCPGNTLFSFHQLSLTTALPLPFSLFSIPQPAHAGPSIYQCPHQYCSSKLHLLLCFWLHHLRVWRPHLIKLWQWKMEVSSRNWLCRASI